MSLLESLRRVLSRSSDRRDREEAHRLRREAVDFYAEGRYVEAIEAARRLTQIQRALIGPHHPDLATGLTNLALLLQTQGDWDAAEPLHREALAIRKSALGERHPDYIASFQSLRHLMQSRFGPAPKR